MKNNYLPVLLICLVLSIWYNFTSQNYLPYQYYPKHTWMNAQIEKDFLKFNNGITHTMIDFGKKMIKDNVIKNVAIITITKDGISSFTNEQSSEKLKIVISKLNYLKKIGAKLPETSFFLAYQDGWDGLQYLSKDIADKLPPIFVFSANKYSNFRNYYILFPDYKVLSNHSYGTTKGWIAQYKEIALQKNKNSWSNKIDKAFWQGNDSDCIHFQNCNKSPSHQLTEIANKNPQIIEARLKNSLFIKLDDLFPSKAYFKYKAIINLDGYSCNYLELMRNLASGSVVIKQNTNNEQWFYSILTPWKHYIPVDYYMQDIIVKTKWVLQNDNFSRNIASNANKLVTENLMPIHIDAYIILALEKYQSLIK